jgi:hypothetical protein
MEKGFSIYNYARPDHSTFSRINFQDEIASIAKILDLRLLSDNKKGENY